VKTAVAIGTWLAVTAPAWSAPPQGADLSGSEHLWWECHRQPKDEISCCSEADGHSLGDADWGMTAAGYWVRVEGKKYDVPDGTILRGDTCGPDPNDSTQSEAKVWYTWSRDMTGAISNLNVLCFEPGISY
jgi:hypothetical protein